MLVKPVQSLLIPASLPRNLQASMSGNVLTDPIGVPKAPEACFLLYSQMENKLVTVPTSTNLAPSSAYLSSLFTKKESDCILTSAN